MTITQMRAMMRRFGLCAIPFVGAVMLLYSLRRYRRARVSAAVLILLVCVIWAGIRLQSSRIAELRGSSQQEGFSITDLGMPAGYTAIVPCAINIRGQIVGRVTTGSDENTVRMPFIWQTGKTHILDIDGMKSAWATCINDGGAIVGYAKDPDDHSGAAIWIDGKMRLLDSPAGCSTYALHVNNEQQICGVSLRGQGYDAVIWNGGQMQAILRSGGTCTCADINNSGDAVGTEHVGSFIIEAYLYHDGKIKGLPGLGGYGDGARSINDNGQIVGWAEPAGSWEEHAAYWNYGAVRDLGTLGGKTSGALCINNRQDIVGYSRTRNGILHPFLWRRGKMIDVNDLLPHNSNWTLDYVVAINDRGQMIGIGTHNNQSRAFVLSPE